MGYFEGFKTSVEEITGDGIETVRELALKIEPEDVTELLQSHDKTLTCEELFLHEEGKCFLKMETSPGEDAMKSVEMIKSV